MTVGNQATSAGINQSLQSYAVAVRAIMEQIKDFNTWVNGQDQGLAFIEAAGFDAADAQTVLNLIGYLNTLSGVYYGTVQAGGTGGTGAIEFDYDNALSIVWGGQ